MLTVTYGYVIGTFIYEAFLKTYPHFNYRNNWFIHWKNVFLSPITCQTQDNTRNVAINKAEMFSALIVSIIYLAGDGRQITG